MKLPSELFGRLSVAYANKAVCVTGGTGFIGSHLVDALISMAPQVRQITVLDDLSNSNLDHLSGLMELEPQRVRFVHGSILDDDAVHEAIEDSSVVFHLAAVGSVQASLKDPQRTWSVNTTGTVRVLEAARRLGAGRVVLASSSSVYGNVGGDQPSPKSEVMPVNPISPYAASKAAAEVAIAAWCRSFGLSGVCLRYFNVFGPRQASDTPYAALIPILTSKLLASQSPLIHGDGHQSRDFTPVSCAVLGTLLAGVAPGDLRGQAINIGTGERTEVLAVLDMIQKHLGTNLPPQFQTARIGDVRHSLADISLAKQLLGYTPIATLETALLEAVDALKSGVQG